MSIRDERGRRPRGLGDGRRPGRAVRRGRPSTALAIVLAMIVVAVGFEVALGAGWGLGGAATVGPGSTGLETAVDPGRDGRPAPDLGRGAGGTPIADAPRPRTLEPPTSPAASAGSRKGPPPCTFDDLPAPRSGLDDWSTTLVDTAAALPRNYTPKDLVPVGRSGIGGYGLVRSFVIDDLRALAVAAAAAGNPLAVESAYRRRSRQADVFAEWVARSGESEARRFSARPGHSEHQLGTALDLRAASGGAPWHGSFGSTRAGRWLASHASDFGFVLSYPAGAEAITCYGAEPWHVRYVGREVAADVAASGMPLRAWLWRFGGG